LVELVDLYPTLAELFSLEPPEGLQGLSFAPLLRNPRQSWKAAAFSQLPREVQGRSWMGASLRTEQHRLTLWPARGGAARLELYDYASDPRGVRNVALDPDFAAVRDDLLTMISAGWRAQPDPESAR